MIIREVAYCDEDIINTKEPIEFYTFNIWEDVFKININSKSGKRLTIILLGHTITWYKIIIPEWLSDINKWKNYTQECCK